MISIKQPKPTKKMLIWLAGVSFLLFQFFLQLSSGVLIGSIMQEYHLTALSAGLLSSSFYYVYTSLQIPVGLLFDRFNTRILLASTAVLCAIGCFIFASSHTMPMLFLGRLTIGAGSAFAFVGMAQIVRNNFPLKQYAFMIGLSETLGFVLTVFGMLGMGSFIINYGWRSLIYDAGIVGLLIACFLWVFIPNNKPTIKSTGISKSQFMLILRNKLIWINGVFVCLEFSVITVFASLWAIPFLQLKLNCSLKVTSILTSMILLGAGLSCPLFGLLSIRLAKRKPLIHASCLITAALLLLILYIPSQNLILIGLIMFAIGLSCGAYMLAYTISNELAPQQALSTCTGFTNTLAMLSAPILQPFIGYLLDHLAVSPGVYSLENYQTVLLIIPAALILASYLTRSLPEKR